MPLQEDARALDILRGVDAGALERCDDTVRLGLVLQGLHVSLAQSLDITNVYDLEDEWIDRMASG
jgi:hypothetical protein